LEKNELNSVLLFINRSVIPIVTMPIEEQRAGTVGTGSIFKLNDKYFLISASHVFDNFDKYSDSVGIPIGHYDAEIFNLGQSKFYTIKDEAQKKKYDIIIIEIPSELGVNIESNYNILNEYNITTSFLTTQELLVTGYPFLFSNEGIENRVYANPFRLSTVFRKPEGDEGEEFDPEAHFLLDYEQVSLNGAPQELRGVSGSPVWAYNPEATGIWTPEKNLKTIGITLAIQKDQYIIAVYWDYVINMFKDIDLDIYQLLRSSDKKIIDTL
jgi:hypothetical protein